MRWAILSIGMVGYLFTGCGIKESMEASQALQREQIEITKKLGDDQKKAMADLQAGFRGALTDLKGSAGKAMDDAFGKLLTIYMSAREELKSGTRGAIAALGPTLIEGLSNLPPEKMAQLAMGFNRWLDQTKLGGELNKINGTLSSLSSGLGSGGSNILAQLSSMGTGGKVRDVPLNASTTPSKTPLQNTGQRPTGFLAQPILRGTIDTDLLDLSKVEARVVRPKRR